MVNEARVAMDGYEVEVKAVLHRGPPGTESDRIKENTILKVLGLGGRPGPLVEHEDTYLSHPSRDLAGTDEALRIRKESRDGEHSVSITYKGPKLSERSKARYEKEVVLPGTDDAEGILEILGRLGFSKVLRVMKKRMFMDMGEIKVSVDEVHGLGLFLEAEIWSEDIKGSEEMLFDLMKRLGASEFERRSYLELLLEK